MSEEKELKTQLEHLLYNKNVRQKYSHAIGKIIDMYIDYIPLIIREYKAGKKVAWNVGVKADPAIFYGNGVIPAAYTELGRLGALEEITKAQDHFQIPVETCSMVKANLGEFLLYKDQFPKKVTYSSHDCEPYNMIFELIKDYGYDVHLFDIGFNPWKKDEARSEEMRIHFKNELLRKIDWLNDGAPPDYDGMKREQIKYNRVQKKLQEIVELRFEHPTYMSSLSYMIMMIGNGHYFGCPEQYEEAIDEFELSSRLSLPVSERNGLLLNQFRKYGAKGVFFYGFLGCSLTSIQFEMTRKYLQENNIPVLNLVGSFDVGSVSGQVKTRIQAFIEMLQKENHEV